MVLVWVIALFQVAVRDLGSRSGVRVRVPGSGSGYGSRSGVQKTSRRLLGTSWQPFVLGVHMSTLCRCPGATDEAQYVCMECGGTWCQRCWGPGQGAKKARRSLGKDKENEYPEAGSARGVLWPAGVSLPTWKGGWTCPRPDCGHGCELRPGDEGRVTFLPLRAPAALRHRYDELAGILHQFWTTRPQRAWAHQVHSEYLRVCQSKAVMGQRLSDLNQKVRAARELEGLAWQALFQALVDNATAPIVPEGTPSSRLCNLENCGGVLILMTDADVANNDLTAPAGQIVVLQCTADPAHRVCWACREPWSPEHACDPATLQSIEVIQASSKPCPRCGVATQKVSGCHQMFCVQCKAVWDWLSGQLDTGNLHNPDGLAWLRANPTALPHLRRHGGDLQAVSWVHPSLDGLVQWVVTLRQDVMGGPTGRLSLSYAHRLITALRCHRLRAQAMTGPGTDPGAAGSLTSEAWQRSMYALLRTQAWLTKVVEVVGALLSGVERLLLRTLPGVPAAGPEEDPEEVGPLTMAEVVERLRRRETGSLWHTFHQGVLHLPRVPGWPLGWELTDTHVVPWVREALGLTQPVRCMERPHTVWDRLYLQLSFGTGTVLPVVPQLYVDSAVGLLPTATPLRIGETEVPNPVV